MTSKYTEQRQVIEEAIDACNESNSSKIGIVWGPADKESQRGIKSKTRAALINYLEKYYELSIPPTPSASESRCIFEAYFFDWTKRDLGDLTLPTDPRSLYNVLSCLQRRVKPLIAPTESKADIAIFGVELEIPLKAIDALELERCFEELYLSCECIISMLVEGNYEDLWSHDWDFHFSDEMKGDYRVRREDEEGEEWKNT